MAAGKINLQSNDGKVAGIEFEDGASSNVTVTVPKEGGEFLTTEGAQTKNGVMTFSSSPIVPNATTATQAIAYGQAVKNTGNETKTGTMTFMDNVGFGVTPVAGAGGIQIHNVDSIGFQGQYGYIWANAKYTDTYRYITSASATAFDMANGSFIWKTAPSGTADNPITWTNAMILDSGGNLLVGTSNGGIQNANSFQYLVSNGQSYVTHITGTTGGTAYAVFGYSGTQIGSITQNGTTAVSYNTTSDYRLKENIRPADCKRFMDIKFVDYERIDGNHECGVIAHELQEVYPGLVVGEKDATEIRKVELTPAVAEIKDEDGNIIVEAVEATYEEQEFPVYQQVNYMGLISRIGTVVQQQAKLIEELRLEVDMLKGAK